MLPLTPRQAEVLAAIDDLACELGIPPTMREIGRRLGISSVVGVEHHLQALRAKGWVKWRRRCPRSLITVEKRSGGLPLLGFVGQDGRIVFRRVAGRRDAAHDLATAERSNHDGANVEGVAIGS